MCTNIWMLSLNAVHEVIFLVLYTKCRRLVFPSQKWCIMYTVKWSSFNSGLYAPVVRRGVGTELVCSLYCVWVLLSSSHSPRPLSKRAIGVNQTIKRRHTRTENGVSLDVRRCDGTYCQRVVTSAHRCSLDARGWVIWREDERLYLFYSILCHWLK